MPPTTRIPSLDIPHSSHTVQVSIIDTTTRVSGIPAAAFTNPSIPGYDVVKDGISYSFLIKHKGSAGQSKHDTLLFDLGTRKDIWNSPKTVIDQAAAFGFQMTVEKNVFDILQDCGSDPAEVGAIIWSHYHVDHTGDPSTFPASTDLIVGPGFKKRLVPAWPTREDSQVDEKAWAGRELREIDFDAEGKGLMVGKYKAMDFYGDGSLYLIDSPGHAIGHMCALARTSAEPPEFILMGGDVAHHGCEFRPTEYLPLPDNIVPNPMTPPFARTAGAHAVCPGAIFAAVHPKKSTTEPFVQATGFIHDDAAEACKSVEKLLPFDAQENIFSVIAHDKSLLDVVDFYPRPANEWKAKGWKEESRWRFLRDFDTGSEEHRPQ
ncbi:hypothetical protein BAUCODRAFT_565746 [Baudoinia panamericana UAMH 10762]|uniref:Metallo-beta-lactamase domain-containing protein n=1 Tax=Baudoinia panamericana (strain UAMH 10762) TaxID=717646 RepID=M2N7V2_BAUPA|nr:uncharacterized protein BAUCODRAFT_565746 [Baudoinia panamericana UAMH 10762]EMC94885.1 hypothetical protein BAUCODRAFT_565746 [Baudoinia panamericana UAMH 10762]